MRIATCDMRDQDSSFQTAGYGVAGNATLTPPVRSGSCLRRWLREDSVWCLWSLRNYGVKKLMFSYRANLLLSKNEDHSNRKKSRRSFSDQVFVAYKYKETDCIPIFASKLEVLILGLLM
ncbi:hypothetical protein BaRGS_00014477 [Batillaria attramentaria]|uniref:Uncharacterized protein n=1 Tax=Batillaria attramentaria TaxID=370345 RepID=A0ABD0L408_9CAEN